MRIVSLAAICIVFGAAQPAIADDAHHKPGAESASQAAVMTPGEIRKIDKAAKKVTLKHGPITNLDMPGMTMVFQVPDAAMLEPFKPGDKVRFHAQTAGGVYSVTKIEPDSR